jgi:carbon starvation protein CstA
MKRRTGHRWLLLAPFAWQAGLAPLVNDVAARPFGLPFPMAWQMAGILLTSAVIGLVYAIDRRRGLPDDEP